MCMYLGGQEEGFLLPRAAINPSAGVADGRIWLSVFGHVQKHNVPAGESFWVDNGCFVACTVPDPNKPPYKVDTAVKGLWQSILSGEGFAMRFEGPITVWTQNRNLNDFSANVARLAGDTPSAAETTGDVVSGIASLFTGGTPPERKKRNPAKNKKTVNKKK